MPRRMQITEPTTMITDYALAAACVYFAVALTYGRRPRIPKSVNLWSLGFLFTAAASAVGGTYHGFRLLMTPATGRTFWLITIGLIVLCCVSMIAGTWVSSVSRHDASAGWLFSGLILTLAGVAIQRSSFDLHRNFNHNDLYHSVQLIAVFLYFRGARLLRDPAQSREPSRS